MKVLPPFDRRKTPSGRHAVSRQKFMKRESTAIKAAVKARIRKSSIQDLSAGGSKKVKIKKHKRSDEPQFMIDPNSGISNKVRTYNSDYVVGDLIEKQESQEGGMGQSGSPDGEGNDDFYFEINHDEYLDYYFEDMELPNLVRKTLTQEASTERERSGYATEGSPNQLDKKVTITRSSTRRRVQRSRHRKELDALKVEKESLEVEIKSTEDQGGDASLLKEKLEEVEAKIAKTTRRLKKVTYIDRNDLRYRSFSQVPVPVARAVMFCVMDVSISMGNWHKEMGKRFFSLLYLFLMRNYDQVDVVFIRHTQTAKEVDEEEFFTSTETGGTKISPALDLMSEIAKDRYPSDQWNIYGCYASDGDDFSEDIPFVYDALVERVLPLTQYFAYVEIAKSGEGDIWDTMRKVEETCEHFKSARVRNASHIYPVFRKLFKKEGVSDD